MNKRSVSISSLILLLALLSFILQVCLYYFIPLHFVAVVCGAALALALTHYFLEMAMDYDSCFLLASFLTISSTAFAVVVYLLQPNEWLRYDYWILVLVLVNWMMPFSYAFLRDFFDHGPRFGGFLFFFHGMNVVFALVYVLTLVKQCFLTPFIPPYDVMEFGAHNFVPFMATGHFFEAALSSGEDIWRMIFYIIEMVVIAIPYGFYVKIYTRSLPAVLRLLIYLVGPFLIEVIQAVTGIGRGDIDDYAFSMVGILIGIGIYRLLAYASDVVNKRDFLEDRTVQKNLLFHL